jgi:hypothetical protein
MSRFGHHQALQIDEHTSLELLSILLRFAHMPSLIIVASRRLRKCVAYFSGSSITPADCFTLGTPETGDILQGVLPHSYTANSFTIGVGEPLQTNSKCAAGRTLVTSGGR